MKSSAEFLTLASTSEAVYKVKASKFLAFAWSVESENEIKGLLQNLKLKFPDADHHCFAWRLGPGKDKYRYYDDGEPSGTAGRPIFGQILSRNLTNVLVVVVRYFGGTKLGTAGLIDAYKTAAAMALDAAPLVNRSLKFRVKLRFSYQLTSRVMRLVKEWNAEVVSTSYDQVCEMIISLDVTLRSRVMESLRETYGLEVDELAS
ncbi:MAG: IMPACT family protein [Bacteroidales bacterium]